MPEPTPYVKPEFGKAFVDVLNAYVAELARRTGLAAKLEPVPVDMRTASLEILPQTMRIHRDGQSTWSGPEDEGTVYRAEIPHVIVLTGKGTGPLFVAECLEASLRAELVFNGVINVPFTAVAADRFATTQIEPRADGEGRFFEGDEEKGPQMYERAWNGVLYLPLGSAQALAGLLPNLHLS